MAYEFPFDISESDSLQVLHWDWDMWRVAGFLIEPARESWLKTIKNGIWVTVVTII